MEILELENLIDNEIEQYKVIEKLYIDKKEILMKADCDGLLKVDSKILDVVQNINKIAQKRKDISEKMDIMTPSLSEIIGYLKNKDENAAKRFDEKKTTVNDLAKSIDSLEKINIGLTQHGIQFTNKTLEAILRGAAVSTKEYNEHGKNISNENLEISSIVEEA